MRRQAEPNILASKKVFRTLKGPMSIHIRDIHIRNLICNTNKQERLNCELAGHFRYARGINKEESPIFRMAILHHTYTAREKYETKSSRHAANTSSPL